MPDPLLTSARAVLRAAREDIHAAIDGLPTDALNWRPTPDDTNSIAVLAIHSLTSTRTWLAVAVVFRYSSLAALAAFAASPAFAWWLADPQTMEFAAFMAVVIWLKHVGNIRRLVRGEETRIGQKP